MISAAYLDKLILNEKRAIFWYLIWFLFVVFIGILLIIVNLATGWIREVGPNIGSAFVLLLAKPPLSEVLKRRDRLTALHTLKTSISKVSPDSPELSQIENIFWKMLQKMLGE